MTPNTDARPKKQCRCCLQMKEYPEFSKNTRNKDGYRYFCKVCEKDKAREYYSHNQGRIKDKVENWQEQNAEKVRKYKRDYYHRQKDQPADNMTTS